MNHMLLVLQRSPAQEAALEAYLASVQVKGSPNYQQMAHAAGVWAKLYGPSESDIQKLTGWLQSGGFTVNRVANGRTNIDFSGSVAQVQSAFRTSIHSYPGERSELLSLTPATPASLRLWLSRGLGDRPI